MQGRSRVSSPLREMFSGCAILNAAVASLRREEMSHRDAGDWQIHFARGIQADAILHMYGEGFMEDGSRPNHFMHQACLLVLDPLTEDHQILSSAFFEESYEIAAKVKDCLENDAGWFMRDPSYYDREILGVIMAVYTFYLREISNFCILDPDDYKIHSGIINAIIDMHPEKLNSHFATDQEDSEETEARIMDLSDNGVIPRAFETPLGQEMLKAHSAAHMCIDALRAEAAKHAAFDACI